MIGHFFTMPPFLSNLRILLMGCIVCIYPLFSMGENSNAASDPDRVFFRDSLVYPSREKALETWTAASGPQCNSLLEATDRGLSLNDIHGDTYENANTQKALFLKKPVRPDRFWFKARIEGFQPVSIFAQCGLVVWNDQDNYIRHTIGFDPPAREALSEFSGKVISRGLFRIYPRTNPQKTFLKLEIMERSVRAFVSDDGEYWFVPGGFSLPRKKTARDFIKGIGILGVGGDMAGKPVFSEWEEGAPGVYQDDDFSGQSLNPQWMLGQTNSGWGRDQVRFEQKNGKLSIHPFSGSDIYLGKENYPFASIPAPRGGDWEIEVKIAGFDPRSPGKWNKGGVVLWWGNRHYAILSLVKDEDSDQIYFESLVMGAKSHFFGSIRTEGFASREKTDAFFRIGKKEGKAFLLRASYDRNHWFDLGKYQIELDEPQVRLFSSGDIQIQYPDEFSFDVQFDYIRKIDGGEKANQP